MINLPIQSHDDQADSLAYVIHELQQAGLDMRPGTVGRALLEASAHQAGEILATVQRAQARLTLPAPIPLPGSVDLLEGNFADPNANGDNFRPVTLAAMQAMYETFDHQDLQPSPRAIYHHARAIDRPAADPEPTPNPDRIGFTVHERMGMPIINPRAVRRVTMPEFEIATNPTIRIDEIRNRRFDLIDRNYDHPFILALLAYRLKKMASEQFQPPAPREATGPKRTVWERLLEKD